MERHEDPFEDVRAPSPSLLPFFFSFPPEPSAIIQDMHSSHQFLRMLEWNGYDRIKGRSHISMLML